MKNIPIIPQPLGSFCLGFGGSQALLYFVALDMAWWRPVLGGAFAIWGLLSWRVTWLKDAKSREELIARIRARAFTAHVTATWTTNANPIRPETPQ